MSDTPETAAAAPPAIRWSCGVTVHNEDAAGRLRPFLEHWSALIPNPRDIILILHACTDTSAATAAEFGCTVVEVGIAGLFECLLWEPPAYAHPDCWFWRLGGADEFVTAEELAAAEAVIAANPDVRLYKVSRRNYCDGQDISDMHGPDWQVALFRPFPVPIRFEGGAHAYPRLTLPAHQVALMDPAVCAIEHRRTREEIERLNRGRTGYMSPGMANVQEQFLAALNERLMRKDDIAT